MSQSDDNQLLYSVRIDILPEIRLYVIQLLQQTLACTLDLRSQIKQACWNVKGHDLVLLHALFATMATELDAHTDLVAERLVVLGGVARGTARTAATHSTLPEYPGAIMDGDAHVRALAERFARGGVGAIVSSWCGVDRRGFIEEAAGVLKHRKRKEKALRKLDAMQANLTRLTDLTGELRRQLVDSDGIAGALNNLGIVAASRGTGNRELFESMGVVVVEGDMRRPTLQAALTTLGNDDPAVGYSVAYPFGVAGPILLLYVAFRIVKPEIDTGAAMPRQKEEYHKGDNVRIIDGPFLGFNGMVDELRGKLTGPEIYHEVLEHRWYLSEQSGVEVGTMDAARSYVENVLRHKPDEEAVLEAPPTVASTGSIPVVTD
jgi:DNA-binding ferritin-like protein